MRIAVLRVASSGLKTFGSDSPRPTWSVDWPLCRRAGAKRMPRLRFSGHPPGGRPPESAK